MITVFSKGRLEAFTDAILAIIITLLVLELRVPVIEHKDSASELLSAFMNDIPKIAGWMISFFNICAIWIIHHRIFNYVRSIDHGLLGCNMLLLFFSALIPFPTAVLGDYPENPTSIIFYSGVMAAMGFSFSLMRVYLIRNKHLIDDDINIPKLKKVTLILTLTGPVLYLIAGLISLLNKDISLVLFFIIPVLFIFLEFDYKTK